jgi:hypothetical protein
MTHVTIEKELYQQLEAIAVEQQADLDTVANEAFRLFLWEQSRRKIAGESAAYRRRHQEIKNKYLGQYVAMHQGKVVDHDEDFSTLYQRVRQHFGRTPVMMTLVSDQADTSLTRHGFQLAL